MDRLNHINNRTLDPTDRQTDGRRKPCHDMNSAGFQPVELKKTAHGETFTNSITMKFREILTKPE